MMDNSEPRQRSVLSFANMQSKNGKAFSYLDYIHYVFNIPSVGPDLARSLHKLFFPKLSIVEGVVFVADAQERFLEHQRRGFSSDRAQYWANLLELDGLFGDLSLEENLAFATLVKFSWQHSLDAIFPQCAQSVRVIADEEEGEVFLTVCTSIYDPTIEG